MQTELGRYRLLRHLATGGMGEVFLAEAPGAAGFAKRLVVKTLRHELAADPALVRQFVAEGQLLEALDHPNIAQILDLGLAGETYFLAMEFVEGFDLRALAKALPADPSGLQRLPEPAVLHVVAQVARALEHAQTRRGPDGKSLGIVHHDVSPSNVMVRRDGLCKLVDFGVARSAMMARLSRGALRGKLPYLSPEHAAQQRVDPRADHFALGLVALELLSGRRALDVAEPEQLELAYAQLFERVAQLVADGRASHGTAQLLQALLQRDPAQRPATAGEVADRAEALLGAVGEVSPARTLAQALAPAFDVLATRAAGLDQNLAQLLGAVAPGATAEATGTLSLPGLEAVQVAQDSARDAVVAPVVQPRGRKRLATAGLVLLGAAVGLGFWLGARRTPTADPTNAAANAASTPPVALLPPTPATPAPATPTMAVAPATAPTMHDRPVPADAELPSGQAQRAANVEPAARPHRMTGELEVDKALLVFNVLPADCQVTVDGKPHKPHGTNNHYRISVSPGDHVVRIVDRHSDAAKTLRVEGLRSGEERTLSGTRLSEELP